MSTFLHSGLMLPIIYVHYCYDVVNHVCMLVLYIMTMFIADFSHPDLLIIKAISFPVAAHMDFSVDH